MRDLSSRALEMSLSEGSVRRVSREVRLAVVDECGVPLRLMTMGRMSTWYLASGCGWHLRGVCIWLESVGLFGRGCGPWSTSTPLSEFF
jgi:hypothetical protein